MWGDCETDLEVTIRQFRAALPGWWYSMGECDVSCHASCAPTRDSADIDRIRQPGDCWDVGFDADLAQPSTLAAALRDVMSQALTAIAEEQAA